MFEISEIDKVICSDPSDRICASRVINFSIVTMCTLARGGRGMGDEGCSSRRQRAGGCALCMISDLKSSPNELSKSAKVRRTADYHRYYWINKSAPGQFYFPLIDLNATSK